MAISDLAGDDWPRAAREAAVVLHTDDTSAEETAGVILLQGIRDVFHAKGTDRLHTVELAVGLMELEDSPWSESWGKIKDNPKALGHRLRAGLKPYGISPKNVRIGDEARKGYELDQFANDFSRYLPSEPPPERYNATTQAGQGFPLDSRTLHETENATRKPLQDKVCSVVAFSGVQEKATGLSPAVRTGPNGEIAAASTSGVGNGETASPPPRRRKRLPRQDDIVWMCPVCRGTQRPPFEVEELYCTGFAPMPHPIAAMTRAVGEAAE